jgi:tetratricopeptide (TPR) repeat protein
MARVSLQAALPWLCTVLLLACGDTSGEAVSDVPTAAGSDRDEKRLSVREEFDRMAQDLTSGSNPYLSTTRVRTLRRALKEEGLSANERLRLERRLSRALLKNGQIQKSIDVLERVLQGLARNSAGDAGSESLLALAYLRLAETENCVARHNGECCIFPLAGAAEHSLREPAEKARALFLRRLRRDPKDAEALWLANICAMALGEYPDGVPEPFRLPESAFASEGGFPRFRNRAPELGLDTLNLCGGAVAEDFDGDGWLDILTSSYDPREPVRYFRNGGDGSFEDLSDPSRASDQKGGLNLIAADYDNDGDKDFFVLRGAWLGDDGQLRNSLVRNRGEALFEDVTHQVGLAQPAMPTQTGAFGDFDGDGWVDLYVGNESRIEREPTGDYPGQLFQNHGGTTFEDVARANRVENNRFCKGVGAGDYDADGDLDLYLSNIGENRLYRNDGGRFRDVAPELQVVEPRERSFATWFFDYDQDGRLDLFVTSYETGLADLVAEALGEPNEAPPPRLYRNDGSAGFVDVASELGLDRPFQPMGANFGDLDHDGWLDIYLTTGEPQLQSLMPNVFLRNDGGVAFRDLTSAAGLGHLQKGHGVAFADFDHDGDQDVFHQLGGFFPVDRYANALFVNPGNGNRWLYLTLQGTESNRDGFGARIRIVVRTRTGKRTLYRNVGALSSFGGSTLRQEIGLGDAQAVESLTIHWPGSSEPQTFRDLPLDAHLKIVQGEERFERLELRAVDLERR